MGDDPRLPIAEGLWAFGRLKGTCSGLPSYAPPGTLPGTEQPSPSSTESFLISSQWNPTKAILSPLSPLLVFRSSCLHTVSHLNPVNSSGHSNSSPRLSASGYPNIHQQPATHTHTHLTHIPASLAFMGRNKMETKFSETFAIH